MNVKVTDMYKQGNVKVLFTLIVHYLGLTRVHALVELTKQQIYRIFAFSQ